jgi:hypothetical protein
MPGTSRRQEVDMMTVRTVLVGACLAAVGAVGHAQRNVIDCGVEPLADALAKVKDKQTVLFTGACAGPVVIRTDGVTLVGVGTAAIDGNGQDAILIAGAAGVTLSGFDVHHGLNGIVGSNGAHVTITSVTSRNHARSGISLQGASSAALEDVTVSNNSLHGLDVGNGSAITVTGDLTAASNRVFGINVNGSSATFTEATVLATGNALGIQIATSGNAFIGNSTTTINVTNNLATGLTVVSGAQLVSFGGTINASGNPSAGVSLNSKAGLDLDAGSTLTSNGNGTGVLIQQGSVMTVFNTPQFSGVPGFSTVNANQNTIAGIRVLTNSTLTLSNQARVVSTQNGGVGLIADNATTTLVNSQLTGNAVRDIQLTFGARADLRTLTLGTATCDATVLVRGTANLTCPQ